jgi:hypothetical protein
MFRFSTSEGSPSQGVHAYQEPKLRRRIVDLVEEIAGKGGEH